MSLVVPADGTLALAKFLAVPKQLSPFAALFTNNVIPDHTFTLASLVEATFPGYARQAMGVAFPILGQLDGSAIMRWSPVNFANTAPAPGQTAYGYFVVQLDAALVLRLLWVERMVPPISFAVPGVNLTLSPQLVVQTLFG